MLFKRLKKARRAKKAKEINAQYLREKSLLTTLHIQNSALTSETLGVCSIPRDQKLIVSLITFDKRINDVYLTIESIFQQSVKADKVVLCIAKDDFAEEDLPALLKLQMRRGLEIEFCEKDLGPHTKYFYTLKKYPDDLIVTVDDDILYPVDMLDQLYKAYRQYPEYIHCYRGHRIAVDSAGKIQPYKQWERTIQEPQASLNIFPTGVGGVLYSPGCFDDEILNQSVFEQLSPKADDIWLKAMSLKKGTKVKVVPDSRDWGMRFVTIEGSQKFKLKSGNKCIHSGNDVQLQKVMDHYQLSHRA
jgi:hypothetical protein